VDFHNYLVGSRTVVLENDSEEDALGVESMEMIKTIK